MRWIVVLISMLLLLTMVAAEEYSDDYRQGYVDAARSIGSVEHMAGLLEGCCIMLDVMADMAREGGVAGGVARGFIGGFGETYNEMAFVYNIIAIDVNNQTCEVLGNDHPELENCTFECVPYREVTG